MTIGEHIRDLDKLIETIVRKRGMKKLLTEIINFVEKEREDAIFYHPKRSVDYLDRLKSDLQKTLDNYETRYKGD